MSNPESFLTEVAEEVRKDQLMGYVRRYGWIVGLVVVSIVGGASFWEWNKARDRGAAEAFGDAVLEAVAIQDAGLQALQLGEIVATGETAVVRDFLAAGALALEDSRESAAQLRTILENPEVSQLYRDVAALRLAQLPDNPLRTDERLAILDPLIMATGPFRVLALELRAMVYVEQRERDLAVADLRTVVNDAEATRNQRARAEQLLVALGEDPTAL